MEAEVLAKASTSPTLRFSGFDGLWSDSTLREVLQELIDCEHKTAPYVDASEYLVVRTNNVKDGALDYTEMKFTTKEAFAKWTQRKVPQYGDILFTREAPAGESCLVPEDKKVCLGQRMVLLQPNPRKSDGRFLSFYLQTAKARTSISNFSIGSTVTRINIADIFEIECPVVPLPEQQKIAAFLGAVDRKIQQLKRKQALLEQYKKGVVQQLFTQELRFKRKDGGEFPEWEEFELKLVCSITKGEQLNRTGLTETGEYPSYSGGVQPSGYSDAWNTAENTITISEGGNSCGFVNFIKTKFWCGGHCYALMNLRKDVAAEFLYQCLKFHEPSLMRLRVGSGLPNVQKKDLAGYMIQLPSLEEQSRIAGFLMALDAKVAGVAQAVAAAEKWKKGLLQQMFV